MKKEWIIIDGSARNAREGLAKDAKSKGYNVLWWQNPPFVRQSVIDGNCVIEWLCLVEEISCPKAR
jgi:hypothetical protein